MVRFLQTDPILFDGGVNLYAYVGNDPVNLTDPLGLKVEKGPPVTVTGERARIGAGFREDLPLDFVGWLVGRLNLNPYGETVHQEGETFVLTAPRPRTRRSDASLALLPQWQCPNGADIDLAGAAIRGGNDMTLLGTGVALIGGTAVWVSGGVWPHVDAVGGALVAGGLSFAALGQYVSLTGVIWTAGRGDPRGAFNEYLSSLLERRSGDLGPTQGAIIETVADPIWDFVGLPNCEPAS